MKWFLACSLFLPALAMAMPALHVNGDEGISAGVRTLVSVPITLPDNMLYAADVGQLRLRVHDARGKQIADLSGQFEASAGNPNEGILRWILPPEHTGPDTVYRCYAASAKANVLIAAAYVENEQAVVVTEGSKPVLRYNQGTTVVPDGIDPVFARADYIHPLWGPNGEILTDDYPADHPHHRGLNWAWATIRWNGEMRDAFAVRGVTARPVSPPVIGQGPVFATVTAENTWQWDGGPAIMAESVSMRIYREVDKARFIDIEIRLTPLVEGLEIGGRLQRGYSGFNLRMAPGTEQETRLRRELWVDGGYGWGDYSAIFQGQAVRSGITVFEHAANPGYPNEWRQYPTLNFFQPAWPGGAPVATPKDQPITLRHRLWIHEGRVTETQLQALRKSYDEPAR